MQNALDYKTSNGETVHSLLVRPLEQNGFEFQVVDVGARNGMRDLPDSYSAKSNYTGFEPNSVEHKKLISHSTDAERQGARTTKWKAETFHDCALWSRDESKTLFITKGAGACSLMGKTNPDITRRMFMSRGEQSGGHSFEELCTEVKSTEEVRCRALDHLIPDTVTIDFLKLDVEGAELAVLEGAANLLASQRILFIKTEFVVAPYYGTHPLLGHQHVRLDECGYRLLDFDFHHSPYTRNPTSIPSSFDRRLVHAGDAFFAVDPDRNKLSPNALHRLGIVSIAHGFRSFGISVIRDAGLVAEKDLELIEKALCQAHFKKRMRLVQNQVRERIRTIRQSVKAFLRKAA